MMEFQKFAKISIFRFGATELIFWIYLGIHILKGVYSILKNKNKFDSHLQIGSSTHDNTDSTDFALSI